MSDSNERLVVMIDSLISRTRFYDITGYLIPGELSIGIIWLYAKVFGFENYAECALTFISDNWMVSLTLIFIAGAYSMGHLVNSTSKLLLEQFLLRHYYEKNSDWLSRVKKDSTGRGETILHNFEKHFGYKANSDNKSGMVIQGWAEQVLPAPSLTTFRFLCFYGMNRTFTLLSLLVIPPIAYWMLVHSHFCCMILAIIIGVIISILFGIQYLRFVKSYSDSIPELLLMKEMSGADQPCS